VDGKIRDNELRKIESVIEGLNVPLRKLYERNRWKFKFLEAWMEVRWYSLSLLAPFGNFAGMKFLLFYFDGYHGF
jgi:hypothetical protein